MQQGAEPDPGTPLSSLFVADSNEVAGPSIAAQQREWRRLKERSFPQTHNLEVIFIRPASHHRDSASLPPPVEGQHRADKHGGEGSSENNLFHHVLKP